MVEPGHERDPEPVPPPDGAGEDGWPVPWQPVWGPDDGPRRRLEALAATRGLELLGALPGPLLRALAGGAARLARRVDRRHARAARVFLTQALGPMPEAELERRVLQAYRHFLRVAVDVVRYGERVARGELDERIDVRWTDEARRARDGGGCLTVTAHLGNWELLAALYGRLGFRPAYAVAKPMRNRPLGRRLQERREAWGVRLLPRRGAMHATPRILAAGGTVGLLLDQRARVKPVHAPFFGRLARCDRSAGVLLRRVRAPVVFGFCTYADGAGGAWGAPPALRVDLPEVLWPEELAEAGPEEIATRVNRVFEAAIRAAPDQYFWLHDRYRDGAPAPAADAVAEGNGPPASLSSREASDSGRPRGREANPS